MEQPAEISPLPFQEKQKKRIWIVVAVIIFVLLISWVSARIAIDNNFLNNGPKSVANILIAQITKTDSKILESINGAPAQNTSQISEIIGRHQSISNQIAEQERFFKENKQVYAWGRLINVECSNGQTLIHNSATGGIPTCPEGSYLKNSIPAPTPQLQKTLLGFQMSQETVTSKSLMHFLTEGAIFVLKNNNYALESQINLDEENIAAINKQISLQDNREYVIAETLFMTIYLYRIAVIGGEVNRIVGNINWSENGTNVIDSFSAFQESIPLPTEEQITEIYYIEECENEFMRNAEQDLQFKKSLKDARNTLLLLQPKISKVCQYIMEKDKEFAIALINSFPQEKNPIIAMQKKIYLSGLLSCKTHPLPGSNCFAEQVRNFKLQLYAQNNYTGYDSANNPPASFSPQLDEVEFDFINR